MLRLPALCWFVVVCVVLRVLVARDLTELAPNVFGFWGGFLAHVVAADSGPPTPQAVRRPARTIPRTIQRQRLTPLQKKKVGALAHWRCQLCGAELTHTYEVDYIHPVSRGGTNEFSNLRAFWLECHARVSMAAYVR